MRVCIASSGLGHVARGVEAWAQDLALALQERGLDVVLCKGGGSANGPTEVVIPCLRRGEAATAKVMRWIPRGQGWRLGLSSGYEVEQATFAWSLIRELRRRDISILHVQDPMVASHIQRAASVGAVPTRVILGHGTEEAPSFLRRLPYVQHLAPWHADVVKAAGVWRPTWTIIPNFVDARRFSPEPGDAQRNELGIPLNSVVFLSVAALKRRHKRIDYLIEEFRAFSRATPNADVRLVLVGHPEEDADDLMRLGFTLLGERVIFLPNLPRERVTSVLRAADVFVMASITEMMPLALLEGLASGLPCVVNDHPSLTWIVGDAGVAADLSRPGALAAVMFDLWRDRARRNELARRARLRALGCFDRAPVVQDLAAYYEYVLAQPGAGPPPQTAWVGSGGRQAPEASR